MDSKLSCLDLFRLQSKLIRLFYLFNIAGSRLHLKIPKAFSVRLLGTRVNARSLGNGERLAFGAAPIFEFVAGVARQFPACIGMDHVVDALM